MRPKSVLVYLVVSALGAGDLLAPALARAQEVGAEPAVPEAEAPVPDAPYYLGWTPWVSPLALPPYFFDDELYGHDHPAGALRLPLDPRVVQVQVDPDASQIRTSMAAADVTVGYQRSETFGQYAERLTASSLRRKWVDQSRLRINRQATDVAANTGGLSIALPVQLPTAMQGILGRGAPSINVSGSERISIAGRSNWSNQQNVFGRGQSLFPQLDMQQDLDINLSGNLGDKLSIDVAQSSGAQTSLANRIAIRYTGYEDEVIRRLDLGNTQLTLPGTQYVSYSGRNDGLFGVSTQARIGGTDIGIVASKQEARSERTQFIGTAERRAFTVDDYQYIERTYFLLQRPEELVDENGELLPDAPNVSNLGSVEVFIDDNIDQNLGGEQPGIAELRDPRPGQPIDTTAIRGVFDRKEPIKDFEINVEYFGSRFPVLVLNTAVPENATLAVRYTDSRGPVGGVQEDSLRLKLLKAPRERHLVQDGRFVEDATVDPLAPVREYELRNFYRLGASGLDPLSTTIQIRRLTGGGSFEFREQFTDPESDQNITYLEVTGLDLLDQTQGGTPINGQDGRIDQFTNANFVDWERGILFFPDLRPFAPRLERPGDRFFSESRAPITPPPTRRRFLTLDPNQPEEIRGNEGPYVLRNRADRQEARQFVIFAEYTSGPGNNTIILRNTPIVEGSEIVAIEGETLVRDRDYRVNYQTGIVELISAKAQEADGQLTIDYSYAPLFSQASKTLIGSSVNLFENEQAALGTAFLFESRGQQERRPRIGEEPSRTLIGDLHGRVNLRPEFMTSLVNLLPFYDGREESRLQVQAEVGHSIPNPNTQDEVYLDDFEGTRNAAGAAMDARGWVPASPPLVREGSATVPVSDRSDNADLKWFNPFNVVRQGDLRPNLTRAEDRDAPLNVLAMWIPRRWQGGSFADSWVGLTQSFDADGIDLSRSQFIDLWINDFRDFTHMRRPGVKLHIDLGIVSEDAQHWPDVPPNGVLDTEDQLPRDRQLDATEDTGIDSVFSTGEFVVADSTARLNASPEDPSGDDWRPPDDTYEDERDPRRWRFNNGRERNQNYRGVPDSEDLDGDGQLDVTNHFFRYTLEMTDTTFLDTDVFEKFANDPNVTRPVASDNGWRRFIIPLDDPIRETFGSPDLHTVKHVRVWLEGIDLLPAFTRDPSTPVRPLLEVAQIDIVGNRWVPNEVDSVAAFFGQDLVVRTVNNREDEAVYEPPFEVNTQTQAGSSVEEREQSLALRSRDLVPGGRVSAFRATTLPEDYSRYDRVRFWLAALDHAPQDSVRFFVRFISDAGNDLRNYYEYSAPIPPPVSLGTKPVPWRDFEIPITDFSDLKIDLPLDSTQAVTERTSRFGGVERLRVVGRPSFTRVQRIAVGVENAVPPPADSTARDSAFSAGRTQPGEIWFNELRAVGVDRDRGTAGRVSVVSNFSDLLTLNFNVDRQDEFFQRLGQARGSGNDFLSLRLSGTTRLDKFLGPNSGWSLPATFSFTQSRSIPRFRTGQDIELRGGDAEREKSRNWGRNLNFSLSHRGSRHWLLKNTLDALSFSYSWADQNRQSPTSTDTSRTLSGRGTYTLAPGNWLTLPLPFFKNRAGQPVRFLFLPQNVSLGFSMTTRRSIQYDRVGNSQQLSSRLGQVYSKDANYALSAAWRPLSFIGYSVTSNRNANLPGITPTRIAGINFGRQTNFNQRFDLRIPIRLGAWITPDFDANTSYTENRGPELSPNLSLGNFANSTTMNLRWTLPFRRLAGGTRAPADTTDGGGFGFPLGKLLARLGDVQTRASLSRNTNYSRLQGHPAIGFRLGIDRNPGFLGPDRPVASVFRSTQSSESSQRNLSGEASNQIALWGRANARLRANYSHIMRTSNSQAFVQETLNWPDVNLDWGPVQNLLRVSGIFPTLTASTRFTRTTSKEGLFGQPINSETISSNWQPLLSLSGTTRSGIQAAVSAEHTSSLRQDFRNAFLTGESTDTRQSSTTVRANLSRTFSPGQRFSFLGLFGSTLRSTVTLSLSGSFNRRTGGVKVPGQERLGGEVRNDRVELNASGSYAFSRNVNGTLGLGFSQFRDFTRTVTDSQSQPSGTLTQRSIRLEASAVMRF